MSRKLYLVVFVVVFTIASILRLYKLGQIPVSLYWDETAMMVDAQSIAETGKDMHGNSPIQAIFPSYGDYKLPTYIWLSSFLFKIFSPNEALLRLPSALTGIGTLIVVFLLSSQLFNNSKQKKLIALFSTLVIGFAPWSIMFSRTAFEGHIGQFFVGLASLLTLLGIKKNKYLLLIIGQVLASLATYSYFSVRFVWPVIFVTLLLLFNKKKYFIKLVSSLAIFLILLIPMMKSPLYHESNLFRLSTTSILNAKDWPVESNIYKELAGNRLVDRFLYHRYFLIFKELLTNYSDNLSLNFLFITGDQNLRHGTGEHGLFLFIFSPFLFTGLFYGLKKHPKALILLITWWLVGLLPASVPESTPHALRSLNSLIPISLIIGFGLSRIKFNKKLILGLSLLIFVNLLQFTNHYFKHYPKNSAADFQDGYKQLTKMINKYNLSARNVWVTPFDGRYFLWTLAYGSVAPEDFSSQNYKNYQLDLAKNIKFYEFDYRKLDSLDHKIIIVDEVKNLEKIIDQYKIQPKWTDYSTDSFGNIKFMLIGLGS
jgi:4-amino-4-deoxy-L-arabinose transferase-like glycosyltransferase